MSLLTASDTFEITGSNYRRLYDLVKCFSYIRLQQRLHTVVLRRHTNHQCQSDMACGHELHIPYSTAQAKEGVGLLSIFNCWCDWVDF